MLISGALVGLAGVNQVLGTVTSGVTVDLDAGIGFDAITVALLGRSHPLGILGAGLLFGAFKAGGFSMQASEGIPVDIVLVIQSLIVLFIAAPPLVRAIFRLPAEGGVVSQAPAEAPKAVTDEMNVIAVVSPKTPILLGVLTLGLALAILVSPQSGDTTFRLVHPQRLLHRCPT